MKATVIPGWFPNRIFSESWIDRDNIDARSSPPTSRRPDALSCRPGMFDVSDRSTCRVL